jgi:hypothetical protein
VSLREQGVVVQHSPLGHVPAFAVTSGAAVALPALPPLDRIRRVIIHTTEDVLWADDGQDPSVAGMFLPSDAFLVYDATGAGAMRLIAVSATSTVRVAYHGI